MKRRTKKVTDKTDSKRKATDGTRTEEPYGIQLNGNTNRAPPWPRSEMQNEKMFILPKILGTNDKIIIQGATFYQRRQLTIGLVTGPSVPDYSNVACQLDIYFDDPDKIAINIVDNGNTETINDENAASEYFAGRNPQAFEIQFRVRSPGIVDVGVGESFLESIQLKHDVNNIRFLSVDGDVDKVSRLDFNFG